LEEYKQRQKEVKDHAEFPDEMDTPMDIPASMRFARYRGLKSFRNTAWDPYENLPTDYGRIFQFQNFKRSKKQVLEATKKGIQPGTFVVIEIRNVPSAAKAVLDAVTPNKPLCVFGLLQYEHRYTVMNMAVQRTKSYTEPIKSKDQVVVMYGFRKFIANPIYSTHARCGVNNVVRFERFLMPGQMSTATMYGPIQFGPAPVLMFSASCLPTPGTTSTGWTPTDLTPLLASGSVLDPNPQRIIAKRIVLSGFPYKIHKKSAVIRHMFFSPSDVNYFKPVQLVTSHGRVGHIKDSVGTHGYMKCMFDGGIKQHDTIKMMLYKRVYPKFTTRVFDGESGDGMDVEQ
jgi:pre-rRNA-processing protein TSR1